MEGQLVPGLVVFKDSACTEHYLFHTVELTGFVYFCMCELDGLVNFVWRSVARAESTMLSPHIKVCSWLHAALSCAVAHISRTCRGCAAVGGAWMHPPCMCAFCALV